MPLGEFAAVRTRSCESVCGRGLGSKIRTEASLGTVFSSENLYEFWSNGLCRKRSEFGYSSRIFSTIDGPVSSNLLAPPTKHTAILDRSNSSFLLLHRASSDSLPFSTTRVVRGGGCDELKVTFAGCSNVWPRRKDRRGSKEERGLVVLGEREINTRRKRGGMISKTRRQSRSEIHRENCMVILKSVLITSQLPLLLPNLGSPIREREMERETQEPCGRRKMTTFLAWGGFKKLSWNIEVSRGAFGI